MSSVKVQKGQQYCCAGGDSTVWQVLTVSADPSGIPHARLFSVERPYEFKTLTCSLLEDPQHYRLLADATEAGVAIRAIQAKLPRRRTPGLRPVA